MNLRRMLRGLVLAALASVLVYAVLIFATDAPAVARVIASFPLPILVAMLALSFGCYAVRAVRWGQLMRVVGHPVPPRDYFYLQFSGQTMSVSPGRVGEVLKPWLASGIAGMPMTKGIALVFAERVADLIAVCILSLAGLSVIGGGQWVLLGGLGAIVIGTAIASSRWFHELALKVIARQSWAQKHHASATAISETIQRSLTWRTMLWSVPASMLAWGLEGVAFFLCLDILGFNGLDLAAAVSVYSVSTIVGALSFLPGGIGLTEVSMTGILIAAGMAKSDASAATLIIRVVTLWWAVVVGWVALASRPATFRRLLAEPENELETDTAPEGEPKTD